MPFTFETLLLMGGQSPAPPQYAVVSRNDNGITIIDVSNPASPSHVANYTTSLTSIRNLVYWPKHKCLFCAASGVGGGTVTALDMSAPATPSVFDTYAHASYTASVTVMALDVVNEVLYVLSQAAASSNYLTALDVSDPSDITLLGQFNSFTKTTSTLFSSLVIDPATATAYVAGSHNSGVSGRLWAVNISNPASMSERDYIDTPSTSNMWAHAIVAGRLIGNAAADLTAAWNIDDPANISLLDSFQTSGSPTATKGSFGLYAPSLRTYFWTDSGNDQVIAIDVADPANLSLAGYYASATYIDFAMGMAFDHYNSVLWVVGLSGDELTALDVSSPASISYTGQYTSGANLNAPRDVILI